MVYRSPNTKTNVKEGLLLPPLETRVYCWGNGHGGVLGIKKDGTVRNLELKPVPLNYEISTDESSIDQVFAGHTVSNIITEIGNLYSWGSDPNCIGRRAPTLKGRHHVKRISKLKGRILKVSHGNSHVCALTDDGEVWAWGDASKGKLGLGAASKSRHIHTPKKITYFRGKKCIDIACGEHHTAIITDEKQILMFGSNEANQLGIGLQTKRKIQYSSLPVVVKCPVKFIAISCGTNHSVGISENRMAYSWGWGEHGRLGHGDEERRVQPELIKHLSEIGSDISNVSCGAAHTCVVTDSGKLFSFGWNTYGQLGVTIQPVNNNNSCIQTVLLPSEVFAGQNKSVTSISCGFAHTAAVLASGELFSWGFNGEGQLGHGHEMNVKSPLQVDFDGNEHSKNTLRVSCGHTHTLCITSDFSMYQIMERKKKNKQIIKSIVIISKFIRFTLLRLRMRQYREKLKNKKQSLNEPEESNHEEIGNQSFQDSQCDSDVETSSSEGSVSNVPEHHKYEESKIVAQAQNTVQCLENIIRNRTREFYCIVYEDELSNRLLMHQNLLLNIRKKAAWMKRLHAEKRREFIEIQNEDTMSREFIESLKISKNNEIKKKIKQSIQKRNERTRQAIEKECQRLLKARNKIMQQSKGRKELPKVRRHRAVLKSRDGNNLTKPESILHSERRKVTIDKKSIMASSTYIATNANKLKTQQLLRHRQLRLFKEQEKRKKEEELWNQQLDQERKEIAEKEKRMKIKRDNENKKLHYMMIKSKLKHDTELARLEKELNKQDRAPKSMQFEPDDEENHSSFKTVNQWRRELLS